MTAVFELPGGARRRTFRLAATAMLTGAACLAAQAVTPAPIPVTTAPGTVIAVQAAPIDPFVGQLTITIAAGSSIGTYNYDTSGSQTFAVPAGKRLVVQSVSMYRNGATPGSSAQIFVNTELNGSYAAYSTPLFAAPGSTYPGVTQPMTFYADGSTNVLINAFRSNTAGNEFITAIVSGYLVSMP